MKNLSKIISRYLLSAFLVLLLTLFLNIVLYIVLGFQFFRSADHTVSYSAMIEQELSAADGQILLSETGYDCLNSHYVWAMVLDDSGNIAWNWNLPAHLSHPYTPCQIAAFSKWYLDDYPVTERITDQGLLVLAQEKYTVWKKNIYNSVGVVTFLIHMVPVTLFTNLFLLFLMVFFFGLRFYRSLKILADGIRNLSEQKPIRLPEKGMTELLARQLNHTSDLLFQQRERLNRRDDARTAWISGVSHDIRTPLSLIMGYAGNLKEDPSLSEEQRHLAGLMEAQSLQIKHLIEDLNLTSRLEYHMQPLRSAPFKPSTLLRELISHMYNRGISKDYAIDLYIEQEVEQMTMTGDSALLSRAFSNLIGNSIRHNPDGCTITVTACLTPKGICFQAADDGTGIPDIVIRSLTGQLLDTEKAPHIMGLRIAMQIFSAHGWEMVFTDKNTIHIFGDSTSS